MAKTLNMLVSEWIELYKSDEKQAVRLAFESYYPALFGFCNRIAKTRQEAESLLYQGFYNCIRQIRQQVRAGSLDTVFRFQFIRECVAGIKSLGLEYFAGSTTDASKEKESSTPVQSLIDFSRLDAGIYLKALHSLPPAQRLIFTLHVVEGFSMEQCAALCDSSLEACRYKLEKATLQFNKYILQFSKAA